MKKMQKWLSVLLVLCMVLTIAPVTAFAAESGSCGENVTWTFEEGVLTISGEGAMYDYMYDESPFADPMLGVQEVVIAEGVTYVGVCAFQGCGSIKKVTLPESLKTIAEKGFSGCYELEEINFPEGLTTIGSDAFWSCNNLVEVTLPDSLTTLGGAAFHMCSGLTTVIFGNGLSAIGNSTFLACDSLETVVLPKNLTSIGKNAFVGCSSLANMEFSQGVTSIGESAFKGCSALTKLDLPEGLTAIAANTFEDCETLTYITLPSTLTAIGEYAFSGCHNLTELYIPMGVKTIGQAAFYECYDLEVLILPTALTTIEASTFSYCAGLKEIWLPKGLTSIGYGAFQNCRYLTDVLFEGSAEQWEAMEIGESNEPLLNANIYVEVVLLFENPFTDVPEDAWFAEPVLWAVANGITNGMTDTTFEPDTLCTREQVVTFLWRAAGCPEPSSLVNPFTDVKDGQWYTKAVLWALEEGITTGATATTFGIGEPCERAAVVTFLWRAMGSPEPVSTEHPFVDADADAWYGKAMLWAVENGITDGVSATAFAPTAHCTRAQIVTFLYRLAAS